MHVTNSTKSVMVLVGSHYGKMKGIWKSIPVLSGNFKPESTNIFSLQWFSSLLRWSAKIRFSLHCDRLFFIQAKKRTHGECIHILFIWVTMHDFCRWRFRWREVDLVGCNTYVVKVGLRSSLLFPTVAYLLHATLFPIVTLSAIIRPQFSEAFYLLYDMQYEMTKWWPMIIYKVWDHEYMSDNFFVEAIITQRIFFTYQIMSFCSRIILSYQILFTRLEQKI